MGEFTLVTELFFLFGFLRRKITGDSINQLRVMSIVNSDGDSSHVILNRFCLSQLFMASNNISVKIMDYERCSAAVVMSAVAILTEPWQVSTSHATAYPKAGRRDTTTSAVQCHQLLLFTL